MDATVDFSIQILDYLAYSDHLNTNAQNPDSWKNLVSKFQECCSRHKKLIQRRLRVFEKIINPWCRTLQFRTQRGKYKVDLNTRFLSILVLWVSYTLMTSSNITNITRLKCRQAEPSLVQQYLVSWYQPVLVLSWSINAHRSSMSYLAYSNIQH